MKKYNEVEAEIGNNKVYIKQYNPGTVIGLKKSGDEWVDINKANKVGPRAKADVKTVVQSLTNKEIAALNKFDPVPIPDIKVSADGTGVVNFPNGKHKTVIVESLFEKIYKEANKSRTNKISEAVTFDEEANLSDNYEEEVDLHLMLKPAIEAYNKVISAQRYADAGWDYSNVNHAAEEAAVPNADDEIINELAKLGINTKEDLKELLYSHGVDSKTLNEIQTPYFDQKIGPDKYYNKEYWSQVKNPNYAKPVHGITFDDVYCINKFLSLLPSDDSNHDYDLRVNNEKEEYSNKEKELKIDEEIIQKAAKKYPNAFDYRWARDIANGRSPMDNSYFEGRVEATHDLAEICKKYLEIDDIDGFKNEVADLYHNSSYVSSHWNFHI